MMGRGSPATAHFERKRPGWFTANVFNRVVAGLTRCGVSLLGSRVLEVKGRNSGVARRTPVNLLAFEGERYLVAPRGETQWARNLRASGKGRLLVGRRSESFTAVKLAGELSAAPGAGGKPIHEWLEVRPFMTERPTVTE